MKYLVAFLAALLVGLVIGWPHKTLLTEHPCSVPPISGQGRLYSLPPQSPAVQPARTHGVVIPDEFESGRLEMPREGEPEGKWKPLVIRGEQ